MFDSNQRMLGFRRTASGGLLFAPDSVGRPLYIGLGKPAPSPKRMSFRESRVAGKAFDRKSASGGKKQQRSKKEQEALKKKTQKKRHGFFW